MHDDLRTLLLSEPLGPDDRVTEAHLAERLGVSRTPIREALQRLESDGLVRAQGRGVRLRLLTAEELLDVFTARAGLEGWAAHLAASRVAAGEVPPARLDELDALAKQAQTYTSQGDLARGADANRAFHQALTELAGSLAMSEALRRWWDQITISTRRTLHTPDRVAAVHSEHQLMLRALRAGDPSATRAATEAHAIATRNAAATTQKESTEK